MVFVNFEQKLSIASKPLSVQCPNLVPHKIAMASISFESITALTFRPTKSLLKVDMTGELRLKGSSLKFCDYMRDRHEAKKH